MIPKECKRLAEVDFPIATVSKHAAKEKSIRFGHPSTLHLWWARRPLAACRSMLLALLLPDPCDPACPEEFKLQARELLPKVPACRPGDTNLDLRTALLKFIGDFANWDLAANANYLEVAQGLVTAAHPNDPPLVVDPFGGGGSIPLEALRLGCEAFASDLNPVACLILKTMLEDIPRHGPELADELRRAGAEIKQAAERELARFYPRYPILPEEVKNRSLLLINTKFGPESSSVNSVSTSDAEKLIFDSQENYTHYLPLSKGAEHGPVAMQFGFANSGYLSEGKERFAQRLEEKGARPLNLRWETPVAYIWARTVRCETPGCGAEIPLVRSFWLSKKAGCPRALRYRVMRPAGSPPQVAFEIFTPTRGREVPAGTVHRAKATCPCCGVALAPERVSVQLAAQHGGADPAFNEADKRIGGARLLAIVMMHSDKQGRDYRLPTERDYAALRGTAKRLAEAEGVHHGDMSLVPDEPLPLQGTLGFRVQRYGMLQWGNLFTIRQQLALVTLNRIIGEHLADRPMARMVAALALSRFADISNALCQWENTKTQVRHLFTRQAIPMLWDFAEAGLFGDQAGDYTVTLGTMARVIESLPYARQHAQVQQADATESPLPDESASVWFTDPPYYDAIPYSDLSDFFYVWLKRAMPPELLLGDPYDPTNPLTPKEREAVQDETKRYEGRPKDRAFFEEVMARAFAEGRRALREDGIGSVVFAHKTTEGWEALLTGMIRGGWTITGSWPIATESGTRLRARESAALATSIHLVCRPRPEDAPTGDWADILRELPRRVGDWMERLQREKVRGADLVFACIGPALEIYSRYARVEEADGREVRLDEYLLKVWEVVGRLALEQILGTAEAQARNGAAGALEEDARLTALFLWTLQSSNGVNGNASTGPVEESTDADEDNDDVDAPTRPKKLGLSLAYDVARRFAQPLGIHLDAWEGRIIQTDKGVVRLLPVAERARQLFGESGAQAVGERIERDPGLDLSYDLFPEELEVAIYEVKGRRAKKTATTADAPLTGVAPQTRRAATTLDRVHAAMLLQSSGQANALRSMLLSEQDRGPDYLRLANALSALYPRESEEKRLLDAMLLAMPK